MISHKKLIDGFAGKEEEGYCPQRCRTDLFFIKALQGRTAFGQTPSAEPHNKEENMDVKVPQRLDPHEIVKLLVALRRALKTGIA
ncbi:hypothetical protein C1X59_14990 [Pseudomonas sp. FW215-R2]|nr:hypothetical protein C1X59_14990 [Pseudomonas sp. FW215-R2]PMX10353.1 hypothetical protein C1X60_10555 [Pseudomonas sp. FW215-L1]PMX24060.1 hypothetical protein C1X57_09155 [Pseudomonas sp. FW215-E1]PNA31305.1 hypothetical protein C1X58_07830 [Pseudomonas sp. FW215-R4]